MSAEPVDVDLIGEVGGVPERFVPSAMRGELVEAEHFARYRWASSFCAGRRVLDAGCGVGYGAEMLSRAGAAEVVATDISEPIVEFARSSASSAIVFEVADVRSLPHPADSFDLIVCFEVIEHVDGHDQVLDEFARVLRPDGLLLISSPNRGRYVPGNPHHRHEYAPAELREALEARFPAVELVAQHVMLASVIGAPPEPGLSSGQIDHMVSPRGDDEIYMLAMAGAQLPPPPGEMIALTQFLEVRTWLERFEEQRRLIDAQSQALQDFELMRRQRQEALELLADAEQSLTELVTLREQLDHATEALASLAEVQDHARVMHDRLQAVESSRSWQLTAPLRALGRRFRRR